MDRIYTLPSDLNLPVDKKVHLYDYQITDSNFNNKINLTSNVISFLVEGKKEVTSSQRFLSVNNDQFLIMKTGHCLMTETISTNNRYKSILLFFTDEVVTEIINKHTFGEKKHQEDTVVKSCKYDSYTRSFVGTLEAISKLDKEVQRKFLLLKLEELVIYLMEKYGAEYLHFLVNSKSEKEQNFINIIEANKLNKLTLKELAFLSHMSLSTFKREFEKHYQLSPIRWFQNQRLNHAANLLKDKSLRPSDIYDEIGYDSLSNFIYAFKKKFKMTPKQYQLK